jgi:hypothetical protein
VVALQPAGLAAMKELLGSFGDAEDPDAAGHRLLELHQANVAAALRPALTVDTSTPRTYAALAAICLHRTRVRRWCATVILTAQCSV